MHFQITLSTSSCIYVADIKHRVWYDKARREELLKRAILGMLFASISKPLEHIDVRAGGARGAAAPPVLKIFGQNAYDSGKSTWDKLFIESSFYNTTKWSILKRLNGSVCCRSLDAGICCSFAPNFLAEGSRTRPLCEIAAVQMKSGKVLVEAFEESN